MESIQYHSAQPENVKTTYGEFDSIDFVLAFAGRSIICNSIRLEADLKIYSTGTTLITKSNDVYIDPKIGGHGLISSVVTQFQSQGVVENLTEYPRHVRMLTDGTLSDNDMLNSDYVCELKSPHRTISNKTLLPQIPKEYGSGNGRIVNSGITTRVLKDEMINFPDFSIKPRICINKVVGQNIRMSYEQCGAIKLSFTLERNLGVLYGNDVTTNYNYKLENVKVCFMTAPDQKPQPLTMINTLCLKSSLTSAVTNLSSKVPAVCNSMSASFLQQDREYSPNFNNVELEEPPHISRISYMFNDSFNQYVSYEIKDRVEMLQRGLDSMSSGSSNAMDLNKLSANESFITGINWEQYIDLSNQKFNVNLISTISNQNAF